MKTFTLKKFSALIVVFAMFFVSAKAQSFTEITSFGLVNLKYSCADAGDFNNDGYMDFVISGFDGTDFQIKLYKNNSGTGFTSITVPFVAVDYGAVSWGDYDNDGYLDLLVTGNDSYSSTVKLYHNNADETFTEELNANFVQVVNSTADWGDYDNDGDLDVFIAGGNYNGTAWELSANIYENLGGGSFTIAHSFEGLKNGGCGFADYDNDGDLDLAYSGEKTTTGEYWAFIMRNNGNKTFSASGITLPQLGLGTLAWNDFNSDGFIDLFISGYSAAQESHLLKNNGNETFTDVTMGAVPPVYNSFAKFGDYSKDGLSDLISGGIAPAQKMTGLFRNYTSSFGSESAVTLAGVSDGCTLMFDYDNDGDLDFLYSGTDNAGGQQTKLFRNDFSGTNAAPAQLTGLSAAVVNGKVNFAWNTGSDDKTASSGLSYNIRIGTSSGAEDISSAFALSNGIRLISEPGDINTNAWSISGLPAGTYYWSVQAVDNSFRGGAWASEESFTISNLVAYYPFTGNANDESGNGFHGTENYMSLSSDRHGNTNQAYSFNGIDSHILLANPVPAPLQIQNEITLSAWIYLTEYPGELGMIVGSQYDATMSGASIFIDGRTNSDGQTNPAGHIHFQIGDGAWHQSNTQTSVPLNKWVHIVATRKANEAAHIYYNGIEQPLESTAWSGAITYTNAYLAIGRQQDLGRFFKGSIDEVRIYNKALNATEVTDLFTNEKPATFDLIAKYAFNGNANDESGNGYNGTMYGNLAFVDDHHGNPSSAVYFNGLPANYIEIGTGLNLINENKQSTICAIVNPENIEGQRTIIAERINGENFQLILLDGKPYFSTWSSGIENSFAFTNGQLLPNQWYYVCNTYNGSQVSQYVNGMYASVFDFNLPIDNGAGKLILGTLWTSGGGEFVGNISEVSVYNRALSAEEIKQMFQAEGFSAPINDRDALVAIYNATGGESWTNQTNWLSAEPIGTWYGVVTNAEGKVTQLNLSSNNLSGNLPAEIGNLSNLVSLNLGNNSLTGNIPIELGNLTNLGALFLNSNSLTGNIPIELGNLTGLYNLSLAFNQLTGGIPYQIGNFPLLNQLELNDNQLTGGIPAEIGNLTNLVYLQLHNNQLTGGVPAEIGNLVNLNSLYLFNNQLSGAIPNSITALNALSVLEISNNNFKWLPDLSGLSSLSTLIVHNNLFTFVELQANLSKFTLSSNYSPQKLIPLVLTTDYGTNGLPMNLDITAYANRDFGNPSTEYLWFKDGSPVGSPSTSPIYNIASFSVNNAGTYYCLITNSAFPGLSLTTANLEIAVGSTLQELTGLNLPGVNESSVAIGDFDNDNDLDILLTGNDGSQAITSLLRNTGTAFLNTFTNLPGVSQSAVAWGDYDNDNDLDVLITGNSVYGKISRVYRNNAGVFNDINAALPGVSTGSVAWGDYDNDGDLDILLSGFSDSEILTRVYRNDNGSFTDINAGFTGAMYSSVAWGDYDADGDLDILAAGYDGMSFYSKVYKNTFGTFTDIGAGLTGVHYGSVAWGDFDADTDLDIVLTGHDGNTQVAKVYRNDAGSFVDIAAPLQSVQNSAVAWGDYDNDGYLDILLSGWTNLGSNTTKVYTFFNDNFTEAAAPLATMHYGTVNWADFDNDKDLDILLTGYDSGYNRHSKIYRNSLGTNYLPDAPTGFSSVQTGSTITLTWSGASDNLTPQTGLHYNLAIQNASNQLVNSPMAELGNGYKRVAQLGMLNGTAFKIKDLPVGNYSWSVQAVDNSQQGSNWAPVQSFTVQTDYTRQDSLALVALYIATDGANWTDKTNWLTGELNTWFGVSLDANRRVVGLNLAANNLTGNVPIALSELNMLNTLVLNSNQLTGGLPIFIGSLSQLTYLDISDNPLEGNIPGALGNLTNLQTLYLGNCGFTGDIPVSVGNMTALVKLALDQNQLTGSIPATLGNLSNLQELYLHYNQLSGNIPSQIWNLYNLRYLYLRNNALTGILPIEVSNLTTLFQFVIANNQLGGNLPVELGNITSLEIINISNNQFTGSIPSAITDLPNLQEFNIENNNLQAMAAMASAVLQPTEFGGLQTAGNKFTFASLEPNLSHFGYVRKYSPQQNIALVVPEYVIVPGETLELNAEVVTGINLGGTNNLYQWFKDGTSLSSATTTPIYIKANYQVADAGNYYCQITNSQFSGITITTDNVRVLSDIPPFEEVAGTGFKGLMEGDIAWGDYDNDGDLDFVEVGHDQSTHYALIYRNDNGVFTDINAGLYPAGYSSAAWGDYDNDNDLDLAVLGHDHTIGNTRTTIYRNDAGSFVDINAGLPGTYYGSIAWGDYNNDGRLDILMSGYSNGNRITKIFQNKNNGFVEVPTSVIGVQDGIATWCDIDNDDDLDMFVTGLQPNSSHYSALYINENGNYTEAGQAFPGLRYSWVSWGDYDADGDFDLMLTGYNNSSQSVGYVYRNEGGILTDISAPLLGVHAGKHAWADYDNDGDLDIISSGYYNGGYSRVYKNTNGVFVDINAAFTQFYHSAVSLGDYDNDNDLDVLLNGYVGNAQTKLYRNNLIPNNKPNAPLGLSSVVNGSLVTLSWDKTTDTETPQNGLKYNVYIEKADGEIVLSAIADLSNGKQLLSKEGRILGNSYTMNLQGGTYNWTVQAVDGAFAGSDFATMTNFTVLVPAIQNTQISDLTALTATVSTEILPMGYTTYTTVQVGTSPADYANWQEFTGNPWELNGSAFEQATINITGLQANTTYYYRVKAYNAYGTVYSQEYSFTTENPVQAVANIPFYQVNGGNLKANSLIDIDNDGDLDAFTSGYLAHTDIYLNETAPYYTDLAQLWDNGGGGNYGNLADIARTVYPKYSGTKLTVFFTQFNMESGVDKLYVYDGESTTAPQIPGSPFTGNTIPSKYTATNAAGALTFRMTSDDSNTFEGWHAWIGRDPENRYYARIFENSNGNFTEKLGTNLPPIHNATTDWADFDLDGDLDLLMAAEYPGIKTTVNVFRNNSGVFEEVPDFNINTSVEGSVEWGDVNNDGYPDVLYTGGWRTEIYINNGSTSFTVLPNTNFPTVEYSRAKFVDLNKDGYLDFAMHGYDGSFHSKIYINNGNSGFTLSDVQIRKLHYGAIDFADYDNDGDQDALVSGHNGSIWLYAIYRNDGTGFNLITEYPGVDRNAAYWLDYNNDGMQDFVMVGNMEFKLYVNSGTAFTEVTNVTLPKYHRQNLAFGDYDNDGDLDMLFEGYDVSSQTFTQLFNIETPNINTAPAQPENLFAETNVFDVNLSWTSATDNSTAQNELTYNLYLRNSAGQYIVSPEANLATGYRFNPKQGNTKNNLAWNLKNLKPDTYTWSVQAIDNSLKGGLFAPEASFTVYGPVTNITFPDATATTLTISWTNGNGSGRLVAVREGDEAGIITNPSNNYPYLANSDWLSTKDQLGESGYYVVYMGDQNTVTLTNVSANKTYHVRIFEYVGTNGDESFVFSEGVGNPAVGKTTSSMAVMNPARIDFGSLTFAPGVTYNDMVNIKNIGTGNLLWTNVSLSNAAFTSNAPITGIISANMAQDFQVSFDANNAPGKYTDTLRINSNSVGLPYPVQGLNSQYTFTGNANDGTTNANNGNVIGAVLTSGRTGEVNSAYAFNGSEYIEIPNAETLKFNGEITVEAWINPSRVDISQQAIASKGGGWNRPGWLLTLNNNVLRWHLGNGNSEMAMDGSIQIPANTWTHVVATWKDGMAYTYVNGVKDANQSSWEIGVLSNDYSQLIGRTDGSSTFYFNGIIDNVSVYQRALADSEISALASDKFSEGVTASGEIKIPLSSEIKAFTTISATSLLPTTATVSANVHAYLTAYPVEILVGQNATDMSNWQTYNAVSNNTGADYELFFVDLSNLIGNTTYYYKIKATDGTTVFESDMAQFTTTPYFSLDATNSLIGLHVGSTAWGDYDNDNDLDLLVTGHNGSSIHTVLYRNENGVFTNANVGFPGLHYGSGTFGDYDGDGDLDILLSGHAGGSIFTAIYKNEAGVFMNTEIPLPQIYGDAQWADYDNDGKLDLLFNGAGARILSLYRYENGNYVHVNTGFTEINESDAAWGDYDNDGDLDLLAAGYSDAGQISKIYRNDSGTFVDIGAPLTNVYYSSVAWGDYDNDGDLDATIAGNYGPAYVTSIYRNDNGTFVDINAGIVGIQDGEITWGDADNDGDPDLFLVGQSVNGHVSQLYINQTGTFVNANESLLNVRYSSISLADYDNDNDLDFVMLGYDVNSQYITKLYKNNSSANSKPNEPFNLTHSFNGQQVGFNWNRPTDDKTPTYGLSYNMYVRAENGTYVLNTTSNVANGFNRTSLRGSIQNQGYFINNLPSGRYYWSVQAVDAGMKASAFAPEQSFLKYDFAGSEQDSLALVALFNATNGYDWINNENWLSGNLETWKGVTLNADRRVKWLYLGSNNLTGYLPAEIGNLSVLDSLNLEHNLITGSVPAEIGNLANLRSLTLWDNKFTGEFPFAITNLSKLAFIDLDQNQFTGSLPAELGNLSNLEAVYIDYNALSGQIPASLGNLSKLKKLYLSVNQFTGSIPAELGNLAMLEELNLSENQLSGSVPVSLGGLSNLKYLSLAKNLLSGEIPSNIGNLNNLISLNLGYNQLTGNIPGGITQLTNLTTLALGSNQLSGTIPINIGNLQNLVNLYLWGNSLSGEIPASIGSILPLKVLSLSQNQLSGQIPISLANLSNLEICYLWSNQLSGIVPAGMGNLLKLKELSLSENNFTEMPFFSSTVFNPAAGLLVANNYLTFASLEPNSTNLQAANKYAPQKELPLATTEYFSVVNQAISFSASTITGRNLGGGNNRYLWYRNSQPIGTPVASDVLNIPSVTLNDAGTYYCEITNTVLPELTLRTQTFTLSVNEDLRPANLTGEQIGVDKYSISWIDNATDEQGFRVYLSSDNGNSFVMITNLPADTQGNYLNGLQLGVNYAVKVVTILASGAESEPSETLFFTMKEMQTPIAWVTPSVFTLDDQITVTFDPRRSYPVDDLLNANSIYMHSGLILDGGSTWVKAVGNWGKDDGVGKMNPNGDGTYSITFVPRTYFGLTSAEKYAKLSMVFRNENGTLEGKDNELADFYFNIKQVFSIARKESNYLLLNGGTDAILATEAELNNANAYNLTDTLLTVEAWVYPTALPAFGEYWNIASRAMVGNPWNIFTLQLRNGNGKPEFGFDVSNGNTDNYNGVSFQTVNLNQWQHLAGTYDGNKQRFYINGELVAERNTSVKLGEGNFGFNIGQNFVGRIDEVKFWSYNFSQEQIVNSANSVPDVSNSYLRGSYTMDGFVLDGTMEYMPDNSVYANRLKKQGNATVVAPIDIAVSVNSLSLNKVHPGSKVTVNHGLTNLLTSPVSGTITSGIYLSADNVYDASDIELVVKEVSNLNGEQQLVTDTEVDIPQVSAGMYYILKRAVAGYPLMEENLVNNTAWLPIEIVDECIDAFEPNSSFTTATEVHLNNYFASGLCLSLNDADWFKFLYGEKYYYFKVRGTNNLITGNYHLSVNKVGSQVVIQTLAPDEFTETNTYIEFYNPEMVLVAENDDESGTVYSKVMFGLPASDLVVTSITPSIFDWVSGQQVNIEIKSANIGAVNAEQSKTAIYLSADDVWNPATDMLVDVFDIPELAPFSSITNTTSYLVPINISAGDYYILAIADYANVVAETDENNTAGKLISINKNQPDLALFTVDFTGAGGVAGNNLEVVFNVQNTSLFDVNAYQVGIYLSKDNVFKSGEDEQIGIFNYGYLAANNTVQLTELVQIPGGISQGDWNLFAVIDPQLTLIESNKQNNSGSVLVYIENPSTCADNYEPNNTFASAKPLLINQPLYICTDANDTDYFRLEILGKVFYVKVFSDTGATGLSLLDATLAGNVLSIKTWVNGTAYDTYIELYDEGMQLLAADDDSNGDGMSWVQYALPFADLTINQLDINSGALRPGETAEFVITVANIGNVTSGAVYGKTYMSVDDILDENDVRINEFAVPSIQNGSSQIVLNNFQIPLGATEGSYYFIVNLDKENFEVELDKSNNNRSVMIDVLAPAAKNIATSNFVVANNAVVAGTELQVSALFSNTEDYVLQNIEYAVYMYPANNSNAKSVIYQSRINELIGFENFMADISVQIPTNLAAGNYQIGISADFGNLIAETNESDNTQEQTISVSDALLSNLYFKTIYTNSNNYVAGDAISINYALANNGSVAVNSSLLVGFYLSTDYTVSTDDIKLADYLVTTENIQNGTELMLQLNLPAYLPTGLYQVIALADPNNELVEISETDNSASYAISVQAMGCADAFEPNNFGGSAYFISGTGLHKSGLCLIEDDQDWFKFNLYDKTYYFMVQGAQASAYGDYDLVFNITGRNLTIETKSSGKTDVDTYITLYDASGTAMLASDDNGGVNNYAVLNYTFSQPDYYITDMVTPNSVIVAGNLLNLTGKLNNSVAFGFGNIIDVKYHLSKDAIVSADDYLLGNIEVTPDEFSFSSLFNLNLIIPTEILQGSYYLIAQADGNEQIAELNDANNTAYTSIYVNAPALPDYVPYNTSVDKAVYYLSETINASFYVKNIGVSSTEGFYNGFYLSKDKIVDNNDFLIGTAYLDGMTAGAVSGQLTINYPIPEMELGYYYLLYVADNQKYVQETNENNNVLYRQVFITAQKPDLKVEITSLSNSALVVGNQFDIDFVVKNVGSLASEATKVNVWIPLRNNKTEGITAEFDVPILISNSTWLMKKTFVVDNNADAGNTLITLTVDQPQLVNELNENNNTASVAFTVLAAEYNLISLTTEPITGIEPGQSLAIYSSIKNMAVGASPQTMVEYYLSADDIFDSNTDTYLGSEIVPAMVPGGVFNSYINPVITSNNFGLNRIVAVVNNSLTYTETSYLNNQRIANFFINQPAGPADLQIIQAVTSITEIIPGIPFAVNFEVKNSGIGYASVSTLKAYYSDDNTLNSSDPQIAWAFINPLLPGNLSASRIEAVVPNSVSPGTHFLFFVVDAYAEVTESNESNNILMLPVTVAKPLSIGNNNIAEIQLFPNPASSEFYVWVPQAVANGRVEVLTMSGKRVLNNEFTGNSIQINIEQLPQGMYMVRIDTGTEVINKKLVVSKN